MNVHLLSFLRKRAREVQALSFKMSECSSAVASALGWALFIPTHSARHHTDRGRWGHGPLAKLYTVLMLLQMPLEMSVKAWGPQTCALLSPSTSCFIFAYLPFCVCVCQRERNCMPEVSVQSCAYIRAWIRQFWLSASLYGRGVRTLVHAETFPLESDRQNESGQGDWSNLWSSKTYEMPSVYATLPKRN